MRSEPSPRRVRVYTLIHKRPRRKKSAQARARQLSARDAAWHFSGRFVHIFTSQSPKKNIALCGDIALLSRARASCFAKR
jgi:hypothetical protein